MPNRHKPTPTPTQTRAEIVRDRMAKVIASFTLPMNTGKGDELDFPLSILVVSSARSGSGTKLDWITTADASVPGKKDGWAHAVCITRDLLLLTKRMDDDFGLGLGEALDVVLARHPAVLHDAQVAQAKKLIADREAKMTAPLHPTVTKGKNGRRIVTDLAVANVEAEAGTGGGNVRKRKH